MIVKLVAKAGEIKSSATVELFLDCSLYNHAVKRINELAVELKQMNDELEKGSRDVSL